MAYSKYNKTRFQGEKPVKEGETYPIKIEGIGTKGDGIGKVRGFVVIVPNVKVGDNVQVKITAVRGKVAFGEAVGKAVAKPAEEGAKTKGQGDADEEEETEEQEEAGEEQGLSDESLDDFEDEDNIEIGDE